MDTPLSLYLKGEVKSRSKKRVAPTEGALFLAACEYMVSNDFLSAQDLPSLVSILTTPPTSSVLWRGVVACSALFELSPKSREGLCSQCIPILTQLCLPGSLPTDRRTTLLQLLLRWCSKSTARTAGVLTAARLFLEHQRSLQPLPSPASDKGVPEWDTLSTLLKEAAVAGPGGGAKRHRKGASDAEGVQEEGRMREAVELQEELGKCEESILRPGATLCEVTQGMLQQLEGLLEKEIGREGEDDGGGDGGATLGAAATSHPNTFLAPQEGVGAPPHKKATPFVAGGGGGEVDEDEFQWGSDSDEDEKEGKAQQQQQQQQEEKEEVWEDIVGGEGAASAASAAAAAGYAGRAPLHLPPPPLSPLALGAMDRRGWRVTEGDVVLEDVWGEEAMAKLELKGEQGGKLKALITAVRDAVTEAQRCTLPTVMELYGRVDRGGEQGGAGGGGGNAGSTEGSLAQRATILFTYLAQRFSPRLRTLRDSLKALIHRAAIIGITPKEHPPVGGGKKGRGGGGGLGAAAPPSQSKAPHLPPPASYDEVIADAFKKT